MNEKELRYDAWTEAYETHHDPEPFRTRATQEALDRVTALHPELGASPKPSRAEGPGKTNALYEESASIQAYYDGVMGILEATVRPTPELRTELGKTLRGVIEGNEEIARDALETEFAYEEAHREPYVGVKR